MQLADLDEEKRSGLKKLDTLERVSSSASRSAQQYEAQIQALHQHVRDARAATRAAEAALTTVLVLGKLGDFFLAQSLISVNDAVHFVANACYHGHNAHDFVPLCLQSTVADDDSCR
jgi:hypothetical protein